MEVMIIDEPRVMMSPKIPRQGCVMVQRAVGVNPSIAFPPFAPGSQPWRGPTFVKDFVERNSVIPALLFG